MQAPVESRCWRSCAFLSDSCCFACFEGSCRLTRVSCCLCSILFLDITAWLQSAFGGIRFREPGTTSCSDAAASASKKAISVASTWTACLLKCLLRRSCVHIERHSSAATAECGTCRFRKQAGMSIVAMDELCETSRKCGLREAKKQLARRRKMVVNGVRSRISHSSLAR